MKTWITALAILAQGCSMIWVRGPDVRDDTVDDCRRSYALPLLDLGLSVGSLGMGAAGVAGATAYPYEDNPANRDPRAIRAFAIAGSVVGGAAFAALFGASGVTGWGRVADCREARRNYTVRKAVSKPKPDIRVVSSPELVSGCRWLGQVEGSSLVGGSMAAGVGARRAREEAAEKAARLGADTVLVQFQESDAMGSKVAGEAFECSGVEDTGGD